jgi:hypothetical protein
MAKKEHLKTKWDNICATEEGSDKDHLMSLVNEIDKIVAAESPRKALLKNDHIKLMGR